MKYAWIKKQRETYSLELLCRVMEVSVSGYLEHWRRPPSPKAKEDAKITEVLREVYQEGRASYGIARLKLGLRNRGIDIGLHRTRSLVSAAGLEWTPKKSFRVTTTDSNHAYAVANNVLDRRFDETEGPNRTWLSDITYVPTDEGWREGDRDGWFGYFATGLISQRRFHDDHIGFFWTDAVSDCDCRVFRSQ